MISSEIVHCLNGLGIVEKEQRDTINMTKFERARRFITYCFNILFSVLSLRNLNHEFVRWSRWLFMELFNRKNSSTPWTLRITPTRLWSIFYHNM